MSQLTDQNRREHLEGTPPTASHRALSVLAKVTLLALLGNALTYTATSFSPFSLTTTLCQGSSLAASLPSWEPCW
jgi:hypothetical protein